MPSRDTCAKVWSEKKFTHVFVNIHKSTCNFLKTFNSTKSRHPKDSKMVRHFIFTKKMSSIVGTGSRNFFSDFTNFVNFFREIKCQNGDLGKVQT